MTLVLDPRSAKLLISCEEQKVRSGDEGSATETDERRKQKRGSEGQTGAEEGGQKVEGGRVVRR
jgi:hypothetical protein